MERPIVTLPRDFAMKLNMSWDIDWRGQPSGEQTDGNTQVVYNAFPRWIGSPEYFIKGAEILTWRALRARAQGRRGIYIVDMCDPLSFTPTQSHPTGIPFSNNEPFSSGYGWEYIPALFAHRTAEIGDTRVRINANDASITPVPGMILSHDDWPFVVTFVTNVAGNIYDLDIQMPLRSDIAVGDVIRLQPRGRFEVIEDTAGNPSYSSSRVSRIKLEFREVLTR